MNDKQQRTADAIRAESERLQSELCLLTHPIWHVLCMRKIGHSGQHWFQVRWEGFAEAITTASEVIERITGIHDE